MINILKSDLYRIFKGKAIYVVILLTILFTLTNCIGMSAGHIGLSVGASNIDIEDKEFMEELTKAKTLKEVRNVMKRGGEFPLDQDIIGQNINLYYLFIVITVISITTDFSNKSIKNTLSSAVSRRKYYISKLLLVLGLSTGLILLNNYLNYFVNIFINGKGFSTPILQFTKLTILQLPLLYGLISLLVCFSFVFRKTSLFNTISIPFIMIIQLVVMGIASLFRLKIDWFYNYEIQFALAKIVSNPTNKYILSCILLGVSYIIIFNVIGYFVFKKAEIK